MHFFRSKQEVKTYFCRIYMLFRRPMLVLLLAFLFVGPGTNVLYAQSVRDHNILILYAYGYGGRGVERFSDGFFSAITEAEFPVSNVYAEYLDLQRNRDLPDYSQKLIDMLHMKYGQRHIDLIITVQQPALEFLLRDGKDIAPQAPVITIQHRPLLETEKVGRRIVGEINQFDIKGTLERSLELFPKARRVVFVSGSSEADIKVAEQATHVSELFSDRLEFEFTTGMTLEEIMNRVANLPQDSIIIFTQYNRDTKGRVALAYEIENMIVRAAKAPVFGFYDYNLVNGGIGGSVIPVETSGIRTGQLAVDILKGVVLTSPGTLRLNESVPMFDWQQILHWGGDISHLPLNTIFINRPPSAWQQYGGFIILAAVFIMVQFVLIIALIINISRRKNAENVLGKSEADFHAIFEGLSDSIVFADSDRLIRMVNPAFTRMFGYTSDEVTGRTTEFLYANPVDYAEQGRRRFHKNTEGEAGIYELCYRRKDGSEFWAETNGTRIIDFKGAVYGLVGVHRDITGRRHTEQVLMEKEATYRSLFENMMNSVVHARMIFKGDTPVDMEYISTNPAFATVTGITEQVVGRRISEVIPGYCENNSESIQIFGRVAATGVPTRWEHYLQELDRWFSFIIYSPARGEVVIVTENITERKMAEIALSESEQRFRRLFHEAPIPLCFVNKDGILVDFNIRFEQTFGYGYTDTPTMGKWWMLACPDPDYRAWVIGTWNAEAANAAETGSDIKPFECRVICKNGEVRFILISGLMLGDDFLASFFDITARKLAEEEAVASKMKLEAALSSMTDAVFISDAEGRFINFNDAFATFHKFKDKHDCAKTFSEFPEVLDVFMANGELVPVEQWAVPRALRGETSTNAEYILQRKDTGETWVGSYSFAPIRDKNGTIIGSVVTGRDITARKEVEKHIKDSEERLRLALDATSEALWDWDLRSGEVYRSPRYYELVGRPTEEDANDFDFFKDTVHPDDLPYVLENIENHKIGNSPSIEFVYRLALRGNEEKKWLRVKGRAVEREADGTPVRMVGILSDITELKQREDEKIKLEEQIQQSRKMESVGRLAGGVAHDFNNMLGIILGYAEMTLDQVEQSQPLYKDLEEIRDAANRSANLTRQLLAFARQQPIAPKLLDLNDTVDGMLKMLRRLIGEDIDLVWLPGENLWPVNMDPSQIDQLLANLCVNARDAISGVGKMTIETRNSTFDADYCAINADFIPGEYVLLAVSDNGCGMDKETQARIFEPFFTTKEMGKGTGLGLATIYGIIRQNNGFINVYSEPGQGTTFTIYLPRHVGTADSFMQFDALPEEPVAHGHDIILLVEDESILLKMTTMMLERQNYTVLAASTPGEAINLAETYSGKISLLITDVVMPDMNGSDLAGKLSSLYPDLKCLFASGYTADVIAHHGVLDPGVNFIQKPFSVKELATKVREVLDGKDP